MARRDCLYVSWEFRKLLIQFSNNGEISSSKSKPMGLWHWNDEMHRKIESETQDECKRTGIQRRCRLPASWLRFPYLYIPLSLVSFRLVWIEVVYSVARSANKTQLSSTEYYSKVGIWEQTHDADLIYGWREGNCLQRRWYIQSPPLISNINIDIRRSEVGIL